MFPNMKLWPTLAFIISAAASPFDLDKRGASIVVGYRTVSPAQAQQYHNAGNTLVWTSSQSSDQLGQGVYISQALAEWPGAPTNWDCVILADSTPWNIANKAWVPEIDDCKPLWWNQGIPNRPGYLTSIGGSTFTASNTILLSKIGGFDLLQLLIPPQLLNPGGGLNIVTQCAAKTDTDGIAAISIFGPADWSSWLNVKGTPQTV